MAYPPAVPPATRTDATVMATNHPADHNLLSLALTEILNHMATMEQALYPIGTIAISGADIPPGNHEFCRGQEVSKTQYPEVFALIGTKFGSGTVSTFTMPNMRGRYPVGYNPGGQWFTIGVGEYGGSADINAMPAHTHDTTHVHGINLFTGFTGDHSHYSSGDPAVNLIGAHEFGGAQEVPLQAHGLGGLPIDFHTFTSTTGNHQHAINGSTDAGASTSGSTGGGTTNANLPPSVSVNYIMRMH